VSQTSPAPTETGRRKIKELEAMVAGVVRETPDTTTLVLFTGNERLDYEAGHFLTIDPHQFEGLERFTSFLEDLKGRKEPVRAYSMSSAPHERYIAFTVKEERYVSGETKYPPLLSPLLVHRLPAGTRLKITGFTGPYTLASRILSRSDHLVHICAGSGSVPNFSILKHALAVHETLRHTFIYSNRTWDDVIFRDQLGELARQHPDRLRLVHTLTREPHVAALGPDVRSGRVSAELIREMVPDQSTAHFFVCGPAVSAWDRAAARERGVEPPPRFLESVLKSLETLGVAKDRITRESYG
jgi:3-ketosteroid 9alpha-monooxygenase subunit B